MDLLRSLPLGLYLEQPETWLHRLDPRVKLVWLLSFLTSYVVANNYWRVLLVALLIIFTLFAKIPLRVWRQQMGWLLVLSFMVLVLGAISPDGLAVNYQPRLPANEQVLTQPATAQNNKVSLEPVRDNKEYSYVLFHKGPIKVNRRSLNLAISLSTIVFTLIYSTNLYLLTTAPEEITSGMESLMQPLRRFKIPVTELMLTLTLSLRFIPLVLEEVQNLIRSVMTRAINWKKLGLKRAAKVWLIVIERLLENLLLRADQMANAMMVRGFTSPNEHRVKWQELRLKTGDWLAIAILIVFWGLRIAFGTAIS
ncbi:energy-coupling factor transporter transmembrane protein EcfT [Anabaena cylindrica FACHB-243]|uniref:ABC-type transporter, integral membrane subunit n=1 Tax=Anabaena cylindrica (strain ATCC 27899 / PCC 7122) TaxID=272123 RepID=K9ZP25_ANACC|nr:MULTISPECIES: energy-coupling factor transporter transmembrane protein EcfT [Anabaena]AFZ60272.1 ABC-type transporter, integral membrane subunit [Anabaena cylindrica PCC 7122]MBD2417675.1 energy-coupling factor transporter transmembrane protein EcfT [Anabaena cylindrica FACHB-243]MBY5281252.1 energy-coupling factor transporter transmembrane protein EcfT [Anabaena sp. CCAP 1446/1C]MBY5306664.1 energy-coupling factor transporter transmembrane protein EcfT [Anabaena sp. CCAP 1446/1C]MCM2404590